MKKNISETVREAIAPTVEQLGYRIWDITFGKIGADYHLEITIDADRGISIDDCEKVHRAIDPILDEADPIDGFYYLDVSSPGLERELRTEEHLLASVGKRVQLRFYQPKDGKKALDGTLLGAERDAIRLAQGDAMQTFARAEIAKITTIYDAEEEAADRSAAKNAEKQ